MPSIKDKLKSRKLWVALAGALLTVLNAELGLGMSDDTVKWLLALLSAYILGQSAVDAAGALRK